MLIRSYHYTTLYFYKLNILFKVYYFSQLRNLLFAVLKSQILFLLSSVRGYQHILRGDGEIAPQPIATDPFVPVKTSDAWQLSGKLIGLPNGKGVTRGILPALCNEYCQSSSQA